MKIRALIAEDEYLAREELIYLIEKEEDILLCPSAETGEQLLELYFEYEPHVIFLDVEMPGLSGVEAAKRIVELTENQPIFIFSTAYDAYAIDAFEIEAVDYLLKPYDQERFQQTMERIRKKMKAESGGKNTDIGTISNHKILIDDGDRMIVLSPESIYYAVPGNRVLEIHTENNVFESKMTLQELENKLKGYSFFRTHRSYLVNLNHVLEITPWFNGACNITLKDKKKTTIPVSRSARKSLFEIFEN